MARGIDYHNHPASVMGKKTSPCGRTDGVVEVWDHGNGYMFVGTSDIAQARRILEDYVDNPEDYVWAARPGGVQSGKRYACRVWLSDDITAVWELGS